MKTSRRFQVRPKLKPGDVVVRRHRLLKTHGTVLRYGGEDDNGASRAWIHWDHPTTLPNPSLETLDDVELVDGDARPSGPPPDRILEEDDQRGVPS